MKLTTIYYYRDYNSNLRPIHIMCKSFSINRIMRPMYKLKVIPPKIISLVVYPRKNRKIFSNAINANCQVKEVTCEKR